MFKGGIESSAEEKGTLWFCAVYENAGMCQDDRSPKSKVDERSQGWIGWLAGEASAKFSA